MKLKKRSRISPLIILVYGLNLFEMLNQLAQWSHQACLVLGTD